MVVGPVSFGRVQCDLNGRRMTQLTPDSQPQSVCAAGSTMNGRTAQRAQFLILANLAILISGVSIRFGRAAVELAAATPARVSASTTNEELRLGWQGDE